jgi:riboflavin kinase/FMN adenylyltransferase
MKGHRNMEYITDGKIEQFVPTAVTLGNFDGLHMGHRSLIKIMKEKAEEKNLKSVVFSFFPHPMFLFDSKDKTKALILSREEKKKTVEETGVDTYIEYPFTKEFASMEPEDFARKLIFESLKCKVLVVGFNYHFGKMAKGDADLLKEIGKEYGVEVICVPSVNFLGERVSSTRIRKALMEADISLANTLLTVPYRVYGEVSHGNRIGHKINFPTMNIEADDKKLFPPNGVYATRLLFDGKMYDSVTNVGMAPTVNGTKKRVETHIFDFDTEAYGKFVTVYFFKFIRPEQKFASVEELRKRLDVDALESKKYFLSEDFEIWKEKY